VESAYQEFLAEVQLSKPGKHWSVVVTYREQRARIISARRSRKEEVALYEG
jgi:uncharacterized DUF497 family protein